MKNVSFIYTTMMPFRLVRFMAGANPVIINYHVVSDRRLPHIVNLYHYRSVKEFMNDLDFFKQHYHMIGLHDLLNSMVNSTRLPENSLMITFDDGFREVYEIAAPLLIERNMTATVFITKNLLDNVELNYDNKKSIIIDKIKSLNDNSIRNKIIDLLKPVNISTHDSLANSIHHIPYTERNTVDEIGSLLDMDFQGFLKKEQPYLITRHLSELIGEGFTFGGHGIDHPRYVELDLEDQIHQTITSVDFIARRFSLDYRVFAFPYSDIKVSASFFRAISGKIDATFGTEGLRKDCIDNSYQRISVEKFRNPAMNTLKYFYFRKLMHQIAGKDLIKR